MYIPLRRRYARKEKYRKILYVGKLEKCKIFFKKLKKKRYFDVIIYEEYKKYFFFK